LCGLQKDGVIEGTGKALRQSLAAMPDSTFYRAKQELFTKEWIIETEAGLSLQVGFPLPKMGVDGPETLKNGSDLLPKMGVEEGSTPKNGSRQLSKMGVEDHKTPKNGSTGLSKMGVSSAETPKNGSKPLPKMGVNESGKEVINSCLPASQHASQPDQRENEPNSGGELTFGDYLEYFAVKKKLPEAEVMGLASALFDKRAEADKVRTWRDRQRKRQQAEAKHVQASATEQAGCAGAPVQRRDAAFWEPVLEQLASTHSAEIVATWFAPLDGWLAVGRVHIRAPDQVFVAWVVDHYAEALQQALTACNAPSGAIEWELAA
jgi:hypothetical protein